MDEKLEKGKNRLRELGILNDGVEVKKKVEKSAKIHEGTGSDDDDDDDDDDNTNKNNNNNNNILTTHNNTICIIYIIYIIYGT